MLSNPRGLRGMSSIMTMKAWPEKLNSSADIPEPFKDHFYQRDESFPYTVYLPSNSTLLKRRDEKLLSLYEDSLRILENTKDGVVEINCSFDKISYIESASMLMMGMVRIYGEATVTLFFNSMGDKIFSRVIGVIRNNISHMEKGIKHSKEEKGLLEFLRKSNLKYLNSAREIIRDEDTVHNVVFQPEIRKKIKQKRGEKTISENLASHVTVLTSSEIIHIREEKSKGLTKKQSYGTVSLIIPLDKVNNVEVRKDEEEMKRLIVDIKGIHNLEFHYNMGNEKVEDFASMCSAFIKE